MTAPYMGHMAFGQDDPMQGLMGAAPAAMPVDAPQALMGVPAAPPAKKPRLITRVHDWLQNFLQGGDSAPRGYDGLLSEDEIKSARPGLLTSLVAPGPIAKSVWGTNMNNIVGMKDIAAGVQAKRQAALEHQQMMQKRQTVFDQFTLPPDATDAQRNSAMQQMIVQFAKNGDAEMLKQLDSIGNKLFEPAKPAELPFVTANAGDALFTFDKRTGRYTLGPTKGMNPDELKLQYAKLAEANAKARGAQAEADSKEGERTARAFAQQNKDLVGSTRPYALLKSALNELKNGNPIAYKSAIINFAGMVDPKAQLRQGIIETITKLDPSLKGSAALAEKKLMEGNLPAYVIKGMEAHADDVYKNMRAAYDYRRKGIVGKHANADLWIPTAEETFDIPELMGAPGSTPVRSKVNKVSMYLGTVPK
jgi:hypothetical protein